MSSYDTLIRGARLVDGTGNPWRHADVALAGDRIAAVAPAGRIAPERASEVVEAEGHVICPGFIDIQSHAILPLMIDGRCVSKITQGVTTEIMGEAWTPAPVGGATTTRWRAPSSRNTSILSGANAWQAGSASATG